MNDIGTAGLVALIVIVLLVLIWIIYTVTKSGYMPNGVFRDTYDSMIVSAHKGYDKYFESPENMYSKTIGHVNDGAAKIALSKSLKAEDAHIANEQVLGALDVSANDAAMNAFIIAELYRFNIAPNLSGAKQEKALDSANMYYARSLRRVIQNANAVVDFNGNQNRQTPEGIIDRIAGFNDFNWTDVEIARNEVRTARQNQATTVGTITTQINPKIKRDRKLGRAKYYEAKKIRNDPQNVHDTNVIGVNKNKFDTILRRNANITHRGSRDEIISAINASSMSDIKKQNAMTILNSMSASNNITSLGDVSEEKVVLEVWKRINSPDNQERRSDLINSLCESLASGMEKNYDGDYAKVCTIGKVSRVLDSLTLMDSSPEISEPVKTTEMIRNEIFGKAHHILQENLKNAPKAVSDAYNSPTASLGHSDDRDHPNGLEKFIVDTKNLIAEVIRAEYQHVPQLDSIIKDAQAGVDI
jgi:hypothetical protein